MCLGSEMEDCEDLSGEVRGPESPLSGCVFTIRVNREKMERKDD